jgi:RpiB/LacA/LacB family sugar-phosphate isomerase
MTVIAVAADHAGYALKEDVKAWLSAQGHTVLDFGTHSDAPVDYPDYAARVAQAVAAGSAAHGVLVCGTGLGMAMAANKVPGIRAASCADTHLARVSREHNDANVLTLGARITDPARAREILGTWLETAFTGGRHRRRLDKLTALEQVHAGSR